MKLSIFIISTLLFSSSVEHANIKPIRICLFVSSSFDRGLIDSIKSRVKEMYGAEIDSIGTFEKPEAYNDTYTDDDMLSTLSILCTSKRYRYVMGLTDGHIISTTSRWVSTIFGATMRRKHIYGSSNKPKRACVISDYSLRNEPYDRYILQMTTVVLHEVGHLYHLHHCKNDSCIMTRYDGLDNNKLCNRCEKKLKQWIR